MKRAIPFQLSFAMLAFAAFPALAQPVISAKSGVVSYVIGTVKVDGQEVKSSETKITEMKENGVLKTEEGRAEVLLTLGSFLRVGDNSSFKMLSTRLIDTRLDLISGTHILEVADIPKDNNLTLAMKDATVVVTKRGLYRFDVEQSRIKVFDGVLGVTRNGQSTLVGAGKMMDTNTAAVEKFDKEATDAMDRWAKRRAELLAMANVSSAKQVYESGCSASTRFASVANNPCNQPCNAYGWNPWYGMITYIPCGGNIYSPYGYRYWSPYNVMRAYYVPPPPTSPNMGGGGFGANPGGYQGVPQTSGGYSGTMSAAGAVSSSAPVSSSTAAPSSGTSTSSAAASAASGAGGGGGKGK